MRILVSGKNSRVHSGQLQYDFIQLKFRKHNRGEKRRNPCISKRV